MRSSLENVSQLERKLNIEVPATEVQQAFENAIKGIQRHVAVKGFRKGKAPLNTVKSVYGDRVKQDVIQDIIQSKYADALKEHSLDPIGYPTIEFDPLEENKDFQFTAEFEVRPEVTLKQIEGLTVKKEKLQPSDKFVDDTLEDIRKGRAEAAPMLEDRPAQKGDMAVINFKGMMDGKPLENGAAEGHELELGSNSFIPGFEEGVEGMRVGATSTIKISFPEDYHVKELAGNPVEFEVNLTALKRKVTPELNDEFAKSLGPYEGLDALKNAIREDFEKRESKRINDDLKNRLMKVLVDLNPVMVPKSLLVDQKKALVEDFQKRMQQQRMGQEQFEEYKKNWDQDFEQTASYMIQSSFLIDKLATEHNLRATNSDLEAKLKEFAEQSQIDMARLAEFYGEQDRKARLSYQVTEEKVLEFLLSKAKIEEVSKEQLEKDQETKA
jgi:trigger factor